MRVKNGESNEGVSKTGGKVGSVRAPFYYLCVLLEMNDYYAGYDHTRQATSTRVQSLWVFGSGTLLLLNETQIIILRFLFVISVLEKHHPTGSKICCCIPRFRTPVCVLSVLVKSAAELQQKSALLGKYSILRRGSLPPYWARHAFLPNEGELRNA